MQNRFLEKLLVTALLTTGILFADGRGGYGAVSPDNALLAGYRDATLIRVGISDDAMTAQEYPLTRISANGPFTIRDKRSDLPLFSGRAGDVATITVDRNGFHVAGAGLALNLDATPSLFSGAFLPEPVLIAALPGAGVPPLPPNASPSPALEGSPLGTAAGPLVAQAERPGDRLKIVNITRRREVPEYRGVFEIVRGASSPNKLSVVNVLSLEDYLKAVVPNELPMRYGWEAVKAQAVAARNYAIRPREKPWKTFDICDSQLCQVYLGSQTETPDSNRAIAETEGLVGLYDGDPILALFSSSHGGFAEDYSNAFSDPITRQYPAPPIPYLRGGADIPLDSALDLRTEEGARRFWTSTAIRSYDVASPYYRWERRWTRPELEAALNEGLLAVSKESSTRDFVSPLFQPGQSVGVLKNIRVLSRGISGKLMVVAIDGSRGTWTVRKEFLIRKVFRHKDRMLPSANVVFTLQRNANKALTGIVAQGGGFGHGVGLSQLGASWMSGHGYPFFRIVQHYYKGVSLGSAPVTVGGTGTPPQPVLTRFGVTRAHGVLWLQEGAENAPSAYNQEPVRIAVNGRSLQVSPSGYRSGIPVDDALRAGQVNTLTLFPDERHPTRRLKAWIELYPPAAGTPVAKAD
jgi:SpoIID/LytB domain protein